MFVYQGMVGFYCVICKEELSVSKETRRAQTTLTPKHVRVDPPFPTDQTQGVGKAPD
jgi:hypothetical protein